MRIDYDLDADALYVTLLDEPVAATREIEDLTFVDETEDGRLIGIEVIGLSRSWGLEKILSRYQVTDADAQQLRAQFPIGIQGRREVPKLQVEKTPYVA
ncbi:DUF2283 domain-containing protein [Thermoactinospora rubra]|uniref:DUF2283 domain-containing protein n=1 Tax=Thermoactinospora rubra TaxID=1088767 RepID=UPI001301FF05|nr:DUF2283 domain-containing protein [Thermoactinospora rubra]